MNTECEAEHAIRTTVAFSEFPSCIAVKKEDLVLYSTKSSSTQLSRIFGNSWFAATETPTLSGGYRFS